MQIFRVRGKRNPKCLIHARLLTSWNGKVGSEQFEAAAMTRKASVCVTRWRRLDRRKHRARAWQGGCWTVGHGEAFRDALGSYLGYGEVYEDHLDRRWKDFSKSVREGTPSDSELRMQHFLRHCE